MKIIVIGTSLSGKTALVKYLRLHHGALSVEEMDESLTRENGGQFPADAERKHKVLAPKIIQDVLQRESIIFFTNTDYLTEEDLETARKGGFVVIQLSLPLEELKRRNTQRMCDEGYEDQSQWLEGMLDYQERIKEKGLVDNVLDASLPTEDLAYQILT